MTAELALVGLGAYLLGSIPSGYLLGLLYRVDVRETGSGNIGATNVARSVGASAGAATLAIDLAKGAVPVLLADGMPLFTTSNPTLDLWAPVVAAVAAVGGHIFPIYLRFRGGKGVATTFGALLALAPSVALVALLAFGVTLGMTRIVSLASVAAAFVAPVGAAILGYAPALTGAAAVLAVLILIRHRDNFARLRAGTEPRLGGAPKS